MAEVWDENANAGDTQEKLRQATPLALAKDILEHITAALVRFQLTEVKLGYLKDKLDGLPPEEVLFLTKPLLGAIETNYKSAHMWLLHALEIQINAYYAGHQEANSYDDRKAFVIEFNDKLRPYSAAIAHPETKEPCILLAVASRDNLGRYTLENRITKKRSGFYKSITELLPLSLVPDVSRKEGVIERRKRGEKSEG